MAAVLALRGAASWGAGDILGGLASRRIAVLTVLAVSQAIGLVGVTLWSSVRGTRFPEPPSFFLRSRQGSPAQPGWQPSTAGSRSE